MVVIGIYRTRETTRDIELLWKESEKMCVVVQIASKENERKEWGSE